MSNKPTQDDNDSNPAKPHRDQSDYFKKWYAEKGEGLLARRRKKYSSDPEARAKQLAATADYKSRNPREPQGSVREIGGQKVQMHRIGTVAKAVGRSVLTLRQWESKGWLPAANEQGKHRVYTDHQVQLIGQLVAFLDQHVYEMRQDETIKAQLDAILKVTKEQWGAATS